MCAIILVAALARPAASQEFAITHSQPQNWAHSVADTAVVSFYFNKSLPFNTDFVSGFTFAEPSGLLSVRGILLDVDAQGRARIASFTTAHRTPADYTWVVYGIECDDRNVQSNRNPVCTRDETLAEPFVLNYSTTSSTGSRSVSGTVDLAPAPPALVAVSDIAELPEMLEVASFGRVDGDDFPTTSDAAGKSTAQLTELAATSSDTEALRRTVVLLLSDYSINDRNWAVRAAARVDASGQFQFAHAREHQFFPIAIRFRQDDNQTIEAFGIHDPDGTGVARPVDLRSADATGVSMRMYAYERSTSSRAISRTEAGVDSQLGPSSVLQEIVAINVDPHSGEAPTWTLRYQNEAGNRVRSIVDPVAVRISPDFLIIPAVEALDVHSLMDSSEILARVEESGGEAYRTTHGDETRISMRLGASADRIRPIEDVFWTVTYQASGAEALVYYLHPVTGDQLHLVDTSTGGHPLLLSFGLEANYPNPFSGRTSIAFRLDTSTSAYLTIIDLQGRTVREVDLGHRTAGHYVEALDFSDTASGVYLVRLTAGGRTQHRTVTHIAQ